MLAQLTQNISPAFNTLCIDKKRSAVAIISIVVGSASVILMMSAITAFQTATNATSLPNGVVETTAGGGEYQALTTNSTFAMENTLFNNYRSLNALEDFTALMVVSMAFIVGAVLVLAGLFFGLHFAGKALAALSQVELPSMTSNQANTLQFLIESTMLTLIGGAVGIGIAFLSAGYMNHLLNNITLQIHMPSIIISIIITLVAVLALRIQQQTDTI